MTQRQAVEETLEKLGGIATLGQLYKETFSIENCQWKTKTPFASIRRIVQQDDNIYRIKPGLYALVSYKKKLESIGIVVETEKNKNSNELKSFNHTYYQGLLVLIGNMKNMDTFIPDQDKNKVFSNTKLGSIRSLQIVPHFSYDIFVNRIKSVDVIWFNERKMPSSLFEIESTTDVQNSLLKFSDLQDFNTRMVIVADQMRLREFETKYSYSAFLSLRDNKRVSFLSFNDLEKQYSRLLELKNIDVIL